MNSRKSDISVFEFLLAEVFQYLWTWEECALPGTPLYDTEWNGRPMRVWTAFKLVGLRRLLELTDQAGQVDKHKATWPLVKLVDGNNELLETALSACEPAVIQNKLEQYAQEHPSSEVIEAASDPFCEAWNWSWAADNLAEEIMFSWLVLQQATLVGRGNEVSIRNKRRDYSRLCSKVTNLLPKLGEVLNYLSVYVLDWQEPTREEINTDRTHGKTSEWMFCNHIRAWGRMYNRGFDPAEADKFVPPEFESLTEALNRRSRPWHEDAYLNNTDILVLVEVGSDWMRVKDVINCHNVDDVVSLNDWSVVVNAIVIKLKGIQMVQLPSEISSITFRDPQGNNYEVSIPCFPQG